MSPKEISFIEQQIIEWRERINARFDSDFYEYGYDLEEETGYLYWAFKNLYHHIYIYLEAKGAYRFLELFKSSFDEIIKSPEKTLETEEHDGQNFLKRLSDIRLFLSPFMAFDVPLKKEENSEQLQDILKETRLIVKKTNSDVKNEVSVYNAVHWILKLYYPSCRRLNKSRFISQFKNYHPDILIPELNTAIEYKLVRKNENIEKFIDQLKIDATNYKGDNQYEKFIAILCLQGISETSKSIRNSWKSKSFPANWELIIVSL